MESVEAYVQTLSAKYPKMQKLVDRIEQDISAPFREGDLSTEEAMAKLEELSNIPEIQDLIPNDLTFHGHGGVGAPGMHPIVAARILEQLQFDGDIPDLRTGPLKKGQRPAVPVDTEILDPVQVGMMLDTASEEVLRAINASYNEALEASAERVAKQLTDMPVSDAYALMVRETVTAHLTVLDEPELDPEGYRRGQVPQLRKVDPPTLKDLADLTPDDRSHYIWRSLSTTQGRRSLCKPIENHILKSLDMGQRVQRGACLGPSWDFKWTTTLTKGYSPHVNLAGLAAMALTCKVRKLIETLSDNMTFRFNVDAVNAVHEGRTGWVVRVWTDQGLLPESSLVEELGVVQTHHITGLSAAYGRVRNLQAKYVFSFLVKGNTSISVEVCGNFAVSHSTNESLWQLVLTDAEQEELVSRLEDLGLTVRTYKMTAPKTVEPPPNTNEDV